jgi:Fe-S cluster biogenesis protein NfuA
MHEHVRSAKFTCLEHAPTGACTVCAPSKWTVYTGIDDHNLEQMIDSVQNAIQVLTLFDGAIYVSMFIEL